MKCRAARVAVAVALATSVALPTAGRADERTDEETRLRAIQDEALTGTVGGTAGFYLKQVNGPVLLADDEDYVHDPASAIKVLAHLHAMREVAAGRDDLFSDLIAYRYPSAAGGDPRRPTMCVEPADEVPENRDPGPLRFGLEAMMKASDNRMTRAAVLRYGLPAINGLAASLDMSSTRWDQDRVGCGYADGKRNAMTSIDAGKLYEAVVTGQAIDPAHRNQFWELMTEQPVRHGDHLLTIIREEAREMGKPQAIGPVAEGLVRRWKGGSYNICLVTCAAQEIIREIDGVVSIPFNAGGHVQMNEYVFGSYLADATAVCPEQPCAAGVRIEQAMFDTADELLRTVIRAALRTW